MVRATPETLGGLESTHIPLPQNPHTLIRGWRWKEGPCLLTSSHQDHHHPPGSPTRFILVFLGQGGVHSEPGQGARTGPLSKPPLASNFVPNSGLMKQRPQAHSPAFQWTGAP